MAIEIDGFTVGGEIGRGGFGVVYSATQLAFSRPVAVKVLHAGMAAGDLQKRFANECRAVGSLRNHRNIVSVYSTGLTTDGAPYLAMQLLPGGSLADRIPMLSDAAAALGVRLAGALQVAHAGGVIHRDVKPSNVLFDEDDEPVLVDFGIAALVGEASTSTNSGDIAVSIGYAPPEVLDGARPGVAADVYALGATLFAAVTGRAPFVSVGGFSSIAVIAARIATQPVEDLRPLGVAPALCDVIEKAMAKDPVQRFASAEEMAAALAPLADDSTIRTARSLWGPTPVELPPGSTTDPMAAPAIRRRRQLAAGVRRHRRAAIAAAVIVLAAAGVGTALANGSPSPKTKDAGAPITIPGNPHGSVARSASAPPPGSRPPSSDHTKPAGPGKGSRSTGPARPSRTRTVHSTTPNGQVTTVYDIVPAPVVNPGQPSTTHHRSSTSSKPSNPPKFVDHAPTLTASSGATSYAEEQSVSVTFRAADPDRGDTVLVTHTSGSLPPGLSFGSGSGQGSIGGTVSPSAAKVTSNWHDPQYQPYRFVITATDSHHEHRTLTLTWRIKDLYGYMPSYIGKYGDGSAADGGLPDLTTLYKPQTGCAYDPNGDDQTIYYQGVAKGAIVKWGAAVSFLYGKNDSSCTHVSGHWP